MASTHIIGGGAASSLRLTHRRRWLSLRDTRRIEAPGRAVGGFGSLALTSRNRRRQADRVSGPRRRETPPSVGLGHRTNDREAQQNQDDPAAWSLISAALKPTYLGACEWAHWTRS